MKVSATSLLSLAAGVIASVAVAAAWVPLSRDAVQREQTEREDRLSVAASLVGDLLALTAEADPGVLERARTHARADALLVRDAGSAVLHALPAGATLPAGADAACARGAVGQPSVATIAGTEQPVACIRQESGATIVLLGEASPASAGGRVRLRATLMFLALGIGVGLIVAGGTRWLLSPVEAVSSAAARIANGGRGVRVEARGPEEIAQLARAVNALAGSIEAREDEIGGRLEVVTQLSSMVAHEVRNPLQSLSLLCALARTEEDAERRTALLQKIEDEIHVLEGVVQRFLRNSGPLQISRSPVDLVKLVQRAAEVAEPEARSKGVQILVQVPGKLPADVDGSLVRRAIENLMLNAIEHAASGGGGQVTAALVPGTRTARLFVDDDGPGVAIEDRERIFQAYYSSKAGGTGLGLALVKQVIVAHGGTIACVASPIGGARFEATLPLQPPGDAT